MKVFIFGQRWNKENQNHINLLFDKLEKENIEFKLNEDFANQAETSYEKEKLVANHEGLRIYNPDYIITLGGDGTILAATLLVRDLETPIMGINLGRLGFLASIEQERIEKAIDQLKSKEYSISKRNMISLHSNPDIFGEENFALNDFTISKRDNSSMIVLHTFIDDVFLNSYWADGLIVSTATGSTGYSLSCGGPIIFPSSDSFILTPIAPHNLNVRPIVISGNHKISFKIEGRSENYLCTMDSRHKIIDSKHEIKLSRNKFNTCLIRLDGDNFMQTIRHKLNWGLDKRN